MASRNRKESDRRYHVKHRDKRNALKREWKHRNRARHYGAQVEMFKREEIFVRDKWICCICGLPVAREDATLDHKKPLARGGHHTRENVSTAHMVCNSKKGWRK
jgi:5-methylcytosine-specific restriction endonuclease McrA